MESIRLFKKSYNYLLNWIGKYDSDRKKTKLYTLLDTTFELIIPLLMGFVIDEAIQKKDMALTIKLSLVMIVLALGSMWAGMQATKYASIASTGFANNIRKEEYKKIQTFAFEDLEKFSVPSLITRLSSDIFQVNMMTFMTSRFLTRVYLQALMAFILSARSSLRLSLIFLVSLPIMLIVILFGSAKVIPKFKARARQYDNLNLAVEENLRNARVVKAFVRGPFELEKFNKENNKMYELSDGSNGPMSYIMGFANFILFGTFVAITRIGGKEIIAGELGVGELVSFNMYAMMLLGSFMGLAFIFTQMMVSSASISRIAEVISHEPAMDNDEKVEGLSLKDGSIDFDDVSFKYEDEESTYQLKDINLHIKSGESIGILGPTGSSKSTLVQLIPRLYDITGGSLKVGGEDIKKYDLKTLRDEIAIVLQKNVMFSGTIEDNLRRGNPDASFDEIVEAAKIAQADEFVREREGGYQSVLGQKGSGVSGGQKQRLCIARSLLKKPKILILDNSTSAVDTKTEAQIKAGIRKYSKDLTTIIISQRITSFADCDRVIVMNAGKIEAVGDHDYLYANNETYRATFDAQKKGSEE